MLSLKAMRCRLFDLYTYTLKHFHILHQLKMFFLLKPLDYICSLYREHPNWVSSASLYVGMDCRIFVLSTWCHLRKSNRSLICTIYICVIHVSIHNSLMIVAEWNLIARWMIVSVYLEILSDFLTRESTTSIAQCFLLYQLQSVFFSMFHKNLCIFPLPSSRYGSITVPLRVQWQYVSFQQPEGLFEGMFYVGTESAWSSN